MLTLLTGENNYQIEQAQKEIVASFDGAPEKFDGTELEPHQLPDLMMGMSLFAEKRLIIIRGLASNKPVWEALPELLERMSDDIHLVLIESSVDKRTKTYKALQKAADVKEFQLWGERDSRQAERWIENEAKRLSMIMDHKAVQVLLKRSFTISEKGQPVIDQWQVKHSLDKLAVFGSIDEKTVETYIDEQPVDSVFSIFETALKGNEKALHQLLSDIEPREDPFMVFGLLSGQVFQLAALSASSVPSAETAKLIGVHPYAASRLAPYADTLKAQAIKGIVLAFAEADEAMKLSKAEPWVLIERALIQVTRVAGK